MHTSSDLEKQCCKILTSAYKISTFFACKSTTMPLIDSKYETAAKTLAEADDEVLQTAGMVALMRLENLNQRMKGKETGGKPLTPVYSPQCFNLGSPTRCWESPVTRRNNEIVPSAVPTWQAPSLPKNTGQTSISEPPKYSFGINPNNPVAGGYKPGFIQPSKFPPAFGNFNSQAGGVGFLFGGPPATTASLFSNEVKTSQSLPATASSETSEKPLFGVFGSVQSSVASGHPDENLKDEKIEEKLTTQLQGAKMSELTKLTQDMKIDREKAKQKSKLQAVKKLEINKKENVRSPPALVTSSPSTNEGKLNKEKSFGTLVPYQDSKKLGDFSRQTKPKEPTKETRAVMNDEYDKKLNKVIDLTKEEERSFSTPLKMFANFEQTRNSFSSQFNTNYYTLTYSPSYTIKSVSYLDQTPAPRSSPMSFGGYGCRQIRCGDRRCGCRKSGSSCHGGCLCSSRGAWCLNR